MYSIDEHAKLTRKCSMLAIKLATFHICLQLAESFFHVIEVRCHCSEVSGTAFDGLCHYHRWSYQSA